MSNFDKLVFELLIVVLCGFCVGVDCVICIVEFVIEKYGVFVYVCYEIVYNKFVVDMLKV